MPDKEPFFSILVPTWNNLAYLQCCIRSIRQNSVFPHEIIVHVNEGTDRTPEFLQAEQVRFTHTPENAGVCRALNMAYTQATSDLVLFLNDDMYVCPGWDVALMEEVRKMPDHYWYLSATMIEHTVTGNNCVIAPLDFGKNITEFREKDLLDNYMKPAFSDWNGATWPPSLVHRELWDAIGGYSEEFSPGMYSDPDFSMKLWRQGVRIFKGVAASRVYHFQAKSTGRVVRNDGRRQFARKWGLMASYFRRHWLKIGTPYRGSLPEPVKGLKYLVSRWRSKLM